MQTFSGLNIPITLEDICHRDQLALLVYDMQVGIAQQLPNAAELVQQVKQVVEIARAHQLRVFFSRHTTLPKEIAGVSQLKGAMALQQVTNVADVQPNFLPDSAAHAIIPDLSPLPSEVAFDKLTMSAFVGSYLDLALRDARIQAVAIVGAVLEFGIEPTVRHAADLGYIPVLIHDACYSFSKENRERTLLNLQATGLSTDIQTFKTQLTQKTIAKEGGWGGGGLRPPPLTTQLTNHLELLYLPINSIDKFNMTHPICAIVGFGPGVSMGVARAFGEAGYALALIARNSAKLTENAQALSADFQVRLFGADAGNEASLTQAFQQVRAELGDPAVLVYNAYSATPGKPGSLSASALTADFTVNVAGALVAVQQVLPAMQARQQGTILLTGGGFALQPFADFASLSVGKAGIRNLTFSLAQELSSSGIHVATVTICGVVESGTHFDPDKIAASYLTLHNQPPESWETEVMYK